MNNNNYSDVTAFAISFFGTIICISSAVIFFTMSLNATSTFQKLANVSFSCFSMITAIVINLDKHSLEDISGLCYCNILGFCMVFGIEIMPLSILQGVLSFCFGLMFFMVWLLTVNTFLLKLKINPKEIHNTQ
ncbi:hypothetical protein [Candidatus Uabimicrobium sp. HlEnr_7]|uniref:hypothetical protein n=1 Tax=Candidatus Uabimicrobium helgolandensis TaxID=3095367 RepID=UPI0035579CED